MKNPKEDLRAFAESFRIFLDDDPANEMVAREGVARWVADSIAKYAAGKAPSLDHAFGLKRSAGRKAAGEAAAVPQQLIEAWRMAIAGDSWPAIAAAISYPGDPDDLGRKVRRHHLAISGIEANRVFQEWKEDGQE